MGRELSKNKKEFCRLFLQTMDADRAARMTGLEDGIALLQKQEIQRELQRMRESYAGQIRAEDALRRLMELAFGRPNDAVKLVCMQEDISIDELDLAAVSEIKRGANGAMEVKLINRVDALERLALLLGGGGQRDQAASFFQALEASAEAGGEDH